MKSTDCPLPLPRSKFSLDVHHWRAITDYKVSWSQLGLIFQLSLWTDCDVAWPLYMPNWLNPPRFWIILRANILERSPYCVLDKGYVTTVYFDLVLTVGLHHEISQQGWPNDCGAFWLFTDHDLSQNSSSPVSMQVDVPSSRFLSLFLTEAPLEKPLSKQMTKPTSPHANRSNLGYSICDRR